jgi:hypothetical protein
MSRADKVLFYRSFWAVELTYRWCYPGQPTEERGLLGTRKRMLNMRKSERTEWRGNGAIC